MTTSLGEAQMPGGSRGAIPADTFAVRLKIARHHANLTIREASRRCGLNYGSWAGWEDGARPRDILDVADRISQDLDIDRDWLLYGGPLAGAEGNQDRRNGTATLDLRAATVTRG